MRHRHEWREFQLVDRHGRLVKSGETFRPDVWYRGWRCVFCGEVGYGVPR